MNILVFCAVLCLTVGLGHSMNHWPNLDFMQMLNILHKHNELRSNESAADVKFMNWNDYLADMAQEYAEACIWGHGQPQRDPAEMPYSDPGQNMYMISGYNLDVNKAVEAWYNEKRWYDYPTRACEPGKICGHYTQVVWAKSREVGCGYHHCHEVYVMKDGSYRYDIDMFVCNYGPRGNYQGAAPNIVGEACTKCEEGHLCYNGLCASPEECAENDLNCECPLKCQNCGVLDAESCKCTCADGFMGNECQEKCRDLKPTKCPGWGPRGACYTAKRQYCPLFCGDCVPFTSQPIC